MDANKLPQSVKDFLNSTHAADVKLIRQELFKQQGERVGFFLSAQLQCWQALKAAGVPFWLRPQMVSEALSFAAQPLIAIQVDEPD